MVVRSDGLWGRAVSQTGRPLEVEYADDPTHGSRDPAGYVPEQRLLMALLDQAVMDYRLPATVMRRLRPGGPLVEVPDLLQAEARRWFFEDEREHLFTFCWVCTQLGVVPGRIRRRLLEMGPRTAGEVRIGNRVYSGKSRAMVMGSAEATG